MARIENEKHLPLSSSQRSQQSGRDELALRTFDRLTKTAGRVRKFVYSGIQDTRLTESQLGVLELLLHSGALPQKDIARQLQVTGGNVTMVVDNLEKRCLVQRKRWQEDRRVVHVGLTSDGRNLIEAYFPIHIEKVSEALSALETSEQEQFVKLCKKLSESLSK